MSDLFSPVLSIFLVSSALILVDTISKWFSSSSLAQVRVLGESATCVVVFSPARVSSSSTFRFFSTFRADVALALLVVSIAPTRLPVYHLTNATSSASLELAHVCFCCVCVICCCCFSLLMSMMQYLTPLSIPNISHGLDVEREFGLNILNTRVRQTLVKEIVGVLSNFWSQSIFQNIVPVELTSLHREALSLWLVDLISSSSFNPNPPAQATPVFNHNSSWHVDAANRLQFRLPWLPIHLVNMSLRAVRLPAMKEKQIPSHHDISWHWSIRFRDWFSSHFPPELAETIASDVFSQNEDNVSSSEAVHKNSQFGPIETQPEFSRVLVSLFDAIGQRLVIETFCFF